MARSRHIGKVVIDWTAEDAVEAVPSTDEGRVFRKDSCYLITGGLGGFGLSMARWLVGHGVRHLALVGRRGAATEESKLAIEHMQQTGATIDVMKVDITDQQQVNSMVQELAGRSIPLRGVFHAAAVLDDGPISELDRDRFKAVMRPKILGARHLDESTAELPLDFFVLFSSVASLLGNARQANYVAANAWFDAFASNRRARGLPATSINWGPIADVGMAASSAAVIKTLAASGFTPTTVEQGMEALSHSLRWDMPQLGLFDVNWSVWSSIEPTSGASPRFANLVANDGSDMSDNPLFKELSLMPSEERSDVVSYLLIEQIAETLRMPAEKLEITDSIGDLGMDSLMAVELQLMIRQQMGVELSALEMMKGANVSQMGAMILRKMNLGGEENDTVQRSASSTHEGKNVSQASDDQESSLQQLPDVEETDVDEMSDEEVEKLLEMVAE